MVGASQANHALPAHDLPVRSPAIHIAGGPASGLSHPCLVSVFAMCHAKASLPSLTASLQEVQGQAQRHTLEAADSWADRVAAASQEVAQPTAAASTDNGGAHHLLHSVLPGP